jgi:hypothetical protein
MFAQIWIGCNCPGGETWNVARHTEVDTHNDEVYEIPYCTICMKEVRIQKMDNGVPCIHALSESEMEAEFGYWGDPNDDDMDSDEYYNCSTCGGEFWPGGTSCKCRDWDQDGNEDENYTNKETW